MSAKAVVGLEPHLLGSLAYADLIRDHAPTPLRILDVGAGVGLPGVPLALAFPDAPVWLVERRQRRAAFLRIVTSQLGLDNVTVEANDVQNIAVNTEVAPITCVTAQAVGRLKSVYCLTRHLHGDTVSLVSRKSDVWQDEVAELHRHLYGDVTTDHQNSDYRDSDVYDSNAQNSDVQNSNNQNSDVYTRSLATHGTLVGTTVRGGQPCPS